MARLRLLVVLCLVAAAALAYFLVARREPKPFGPDVAPTFAFDGDSSALKHTQVVATLDTPIQKGKNVIWCASFQAAWKKLQDGLAGGPVKLEGAPALAEALNRAYTPGREIPAGSLYTAVGWEDKGILEQIRRDVAQQFPGSEPPTFPDIAHGSFVAHSHLEARVRFGLPYFQSVKPLEFIGGDGGRTGVSSFGIRLEDDYAYDQLREQPRVLVSNAFDLMSGRGRVADAPPQPKDYQGGIKATECIVDLDHISQPSQIIVAMVAPKRTLSETLTSVEEKLQRQPAADRGLVSRDALLVPDVIYRLTHHFAELERLRLLNPTLKNQRMDIAQQDVLFRLDRSGAELRAESKLYMQPTAMYYVFDHPFLIIMRARGETRPYFVMWVENAELLRPM